MDYFDENNEVVDLEKKIFEEKYKQQNARAKKILTITFGILGLVLTILGLIFYLAFINIEEVLAYSLGFSLLGTGIMFLICVLIFRLIPDTINYEKYKKRINRGGYISIYEMNARMAVLEEKNKILESKIQKLEEEIRKLK